MATQETINEALEYNKTHTLKQTGEKFGVSGNTISLWKGKAGKQKTTRRGEISKDLPAFQTKSNEIDSLRDKIIEMAMTDPQMRLKVIDFIMSELKK